MRKLVIAALFTTAVSASFAQGKLDDVQEKIAKNKYDEAKEKIDKYLEDPKNQKVANAWYYKGKIYAELARQDSANTLTYDAAGQAYDAFQKYQQMDPKNIMMTIDQNVGLFQLYDYHYNRGVKAYTAKDYDNAFSRFKSALDIEEYIAKKGYSYNGFSFPVLDTQLVNLTGSSAYLAKKEALAMPYFEKLADAKVADKDYRDTYALLGTYYMENNDQAKADKYLSLGRQLFPDEEYWVGIEFGNPGNDKDKRLARFEQLLKKYPNNFNLQMDYAIDLFNYAYSYETKPADYTARVARVDAALKHAVEMQPNSALANYVYSQNLYNQIYDLDDAARAIRGTTAADQAKKKDIQAKMTAKYEEMGAAAQKAYDLYTAQPELKASDKGNYRKLLSQLVDYYTRKKDTEKANLYQDKLKNFKF